MWRIPLSLIAGGQGTEITFTVDEDIGNLWDYLGQPSQPVNVELIADGCDLGNIFIPSEFNGASTFQLTALNGGRFLGNGGAGGVGGPDLGSGGTSGGSGVFGSPAVASEGFLVNINIDNGYLLGGGGGGGGGATADRGATADSGGGGGGGQGFNGGTGGTAGTGSVPAAQNGQDGTRLNAGNGGLGGGTDIPTADGGFGGEFGSGGGLGYSDGQLVGGFGGRAGAAFQPSFAPAEVVFNGSKSEATLRTENRIKGETDGAVILPFNGLVTGTNLSVFTLAWEFQGSGVLQSRDTTGGGTVTPITGQWWRDYTFGAGTARLDNTLYEVALIHQAQGTYDTGTAVGTYGGFLAEFSITDSAFRDVDGIFEIRRTAAAGGGAGTNLAQGRLNIMMEDGS